MKSRIFLISILISSLSLVVTFKYFNTFENIFHDSFFKSRYYGKTREGSIKDIVIVDIDGRSESKLGRYQNWSRESYAKVLNVLKQKKSRLVAFDVLLPKSKDAKEDSIFNKAIKNNGKVLLGFNFDVTDTANFIYPDSINKSFILNRAFKNTGFETPVRDIMDLGYLKFQQSAIGSGHINMIHSSDGVIRNASLLFNYQGKLYPSIALLTSLKYLNVKFSDVILNDKQEIILKNAEIPLVSNIKIDNSGTKQSVFTTFSNYIFNKKIDKKKTIKFTNFKVNVKKQEICIPFSNNHNIRVVKFKDKDYLAIIDENDVVELIISDNFIKDNKNEFYKISFKELEIRKHRVKYSEKKNTYSIKNVAFGSVIRDLKIPLNKNNEMKIHYKGTWKTFMTVPFYDVYINRIGRNTLKNKIILVGASLRGLMDLRSTPIQKNFPGVEVHANIINTILTNDFIKTLPAFVNYLLLIFLILTTCFLFLSSINTLLSFFIIVIISVGYYFGAFYLFTEYNYLINIFSPLFVIAFTTIVSYTAKYLNEVKDKKFIKNTLGKYVPEVVSDAMLKDSKLLKVGGERKCITMLFTDIRNFTSISEEINPQMLIKFLNNYLMEMTNCIKENEGTLDKFIGDCIVCFFGAPLDNNHQYKACKSALAMAKRLKEIKPFFEHDLLRNIKTGIGLNTGDVTVGNIGSDDLFDYTAIGDHMNLASRLEGLNKYYGTSILISEYTYESVKDDFIVRLVDNVIVKGRQQPVKIYELLEDKNIGISSKKQKMINLYDQAFHEYSNGCFKEAIKILDEIEIFYENDGPTLNLRKRSVDLLKSSSVDNWNGVWVMKDK